MQQRFEMTTSDLPVEKAKIPDNYTEHPSPDNTYLFMTPAQVIEMDFSVITWQWIYFVPMAFRLRCSSFRNLLLILSTARALHLISKSCCKTIQDLMWKKMIQKNIIEESMSRARLQKT